MTIPNWVSIALVVAFLVLGVLVLPIVDVGLRLAVGFAMLVLGFFLNAARVMGGGDAKMIAASAPYVAFPDVAIVLVIFSATLLVTLVLHRIAKAIPAIRRATPNWASWEAGRNFPMGISIGLALVVYLGLSAWAGLNAA